MIVGLETGSMVRTASSGSAEAPTRIRLEKIVLVPPLKRSERGGNKVDREGEEKTGLKEKVKTKSKQTSLSTLVILLGVVSG